MRQLFLDTETTGFDFKKGHRIIEFGAVEMIDRKLTGNHLHFYFKPDIEVEAGAFQVHGISNDFLADKPLIEDKIDEIMSYLAGAELVIHNAAFDVPFIDWELGRLKANKWGAVEDHCRIVDTLIMARKRHPGQKNNLDALCARYGVNNKHRTRHGALLDAEILADVYLFMTGGQTSLQFSQATGVGEAKNESRMGWRADRNVRLKNLYDRAIPLKEHEQYMQLLAKKSGDVPLWQKLEADLKADDEI